MDRYPRAARSARIKCVSCNAPVVETVDGGYACVGCGGSPISSTGSTDTDGPVEERAAATGGRDDADATVTREGVADGRVASDGAGVEGVTGDDVGDEGVAGDGTGGEDSTGDGAGDEGVTGDDVGDGGVADDD